MAYRSAFNLILLISGSLAITPLPVVREDNSPECEETDNGDCLTDKQLLVTTTHGDVKGHLMEGSPDIRAFLDIPYASITKPFQDPEQAVKWQEPREVLKHEKLCPQLKKGEALGDLDCLTLSIFSPLHPENSSILFHIHHGDLEHGSGNPNIYGPQFLVSKGLILVLPNYRLGPLGFMCMHDERVPGNAALKDLTFALIWIKKNAVNFGGNPDSITVSGLSAAGALVSMLAISPMSNSLFNNAITESGSALSPWALDLYPETKANSLIEDLLSQYSGHTEESILDEISIPQLLKAASDGSYRFMPCVENKTDNLFLNETPWSLLSEMKSDISFMIGSTDNAGMREAVNLDDKVMDNLSEDLSILLPVDLKFNNGQLKNYALTAIRKQYFAETISRDSLSVYYTDVEYLCPALRLARYLANITASVFFYEFAYEGGRNFGKYVIPHSLNGSARGDLLGYVFKDSETGADIEEEDKNMVDFMTDLWISFARTSIPKSESVNWEKFVVDLAEANSLKINTEVTSVNNLHKDRVALWTQIYNDHYIHRDSAVSLLGQGHRGCILGIMMTILLY